MEWDFSTVVLDSLFLCLSLFVIVGWSHVVTRKKDGMKLQILTSLCNYSTVVKLEPEDFVASLYAKC